MKIQTSFTTLLPSIVAICAFPFFAQAVTAQVTSVVSGTVVTTDGSPVVGAIISVDDAAPSTQTDAAGKFQLAGVATGSHRVLVRRSGFTESAASVLIPEGVGGSPTVRITLVPRVATLVGVTVIGSNTDLAETRERLERVPGSVAMVEAPQIRATRQANLKDVLQYVPGIFVQPRFGAADESQISIRGSGLRDNFHARGVNLLVNGMPYRNADGFTDFESLEMLTTQAIQVYKGGNALRYGGSTLGGAISLDTKTGYSSDPVSVFGEGGSFGFYKTQLESGGTRGGSDYYASYGRTSLGGYRDWSAQRRDRINLHGGYRLSENTDARLFYFFAHVKEELPGALTRAQFESDPHAADAGNVSNRWGRDYTLQHVGVQLRAQLTPRQRLEFSPYMQYRDIDHPIFEVISQISHDYGAELRYENTADAGALGNHFTLGLQPAYESLLNHQYQNNAGSHGTLTKNQHDRATTLAMYAEDALSISRRLTAVLGLRAERATRRTRDFFLSNGDQSDERTYTPVSPKVGVLFSPSSDAVQFFANASRSYEPPLLLELNSLTVPGYIALEGQSAWQYEVGGRGRRLGLSWDLAVYDVELRNEILNINVQPFPNAPFTVPTYRNSPKTRHSGIEAGASYQVPGAVFVRGDIADHLSVRTAYTFARYTFVEDPSYDGKQIPGAPNHLLSAELKYTHPAGLSIAPSVEWVPRSYFLDSQNTVRNDAWSSVSLRTELATARGLTLFAAGQNLANRRFSQSAQVDNAAGKYYEPSDGRSFYGGLRWTP